MIEPLSIKVNGYTEADKKYKLSCPMYLAVDQTHELPNDIQDFLLELGDTDLSDDKTNQAS